MNHYQEIIRQGLWKNNPGLVQLLGLCPLLGVTNSLANALGLGGVSYRHLRAHETVLDLV